MCGIVAYFGGAGNNLTRVLTGMSAIFYRAPDSTGIGLFGDDTEPVRTRKSVGSISQLLDVLHRKGIYPCPERHLPPLEETPNGRPDLSAQQRRLLVFEGLSLEIYDSIQSGRASYPNFDELVELDCENPRRLSAGWPGRPDPNPVFYIKSKKNLIRLIQRLINEYDLSPLVIQAVIRKSLADTLSRKGDPDPLEIGTGDILVSFDRLFENILAGERISKPQRVNGSHYPKNPFARKYVWRYLVESPIQVPEDYDRDGVRCVFRLLDAALLSCSAHTPLLGERLERILETLWPAPQQPAPVNWRTLYGAEKGANIFGLAAAAALTYLQRAEFPQARPGTGKTVVEGETDPNSLRYFAAPILAHGRWAMQSAISAKNAHPFCDALKQRLIVLNGQFDSQSEETIRTFLKRVGKFSFRSENSAEYLALLWGYYFDLCKAEQQRGDAIGAQVETGLEYPSSGSQTLDYRVYQQVKGKPAAELDKIALIQAVRQIVSNGGQAAVAGMSLYSPGRLYVASHNRPVFVVHRLENDDFMVVSDINAAMGLFPQELIQTQTLAIEKLKKDHRAWLARLKAEDASPQALKDCRSTFEAKLNSLNESFRVAIYPLDGEEIFAEIETALEAGCIKRMIRITDFEGNPLPEIEPFETTLNPAHVKKDLQRSFHETHLHEIPERLTEILRFFQPAEGELPVYNLHQKRFRQHFGRDWSGLKRMVIFGTGSAYHMGRIAKGFIHALMPEMDLLLLKPGEAENLARVIQPAKDLVILLSWSATTADMVQTAKALVPLNAVTVGITEKIFADMALIVQKSGGVIPILSGEEVTVSALKSAVCMLFGLELFSIWIATRKGRLTEAERSLEKLASIPEAVSQLLDNASLKTASRELATNYGNNRATFVINPACGAGPEITLKLEENVWNAIGKEIIYPDGPDPQLLKKMTGALVLVNATYERYLQDAISVVQKLHAAGIRFTAVTFDSPQKEQISEHSQGRTILLPRLDDTLQSFIDLVFYYQFALYYGFAHGHGIGIPPRNRAKSLTAARSLSPKKRTAATKLQHLQDDNSRLPDPALFRAGLERETLWEKSASSGLERDYYRRMRGLAGCLVAEDPLTEIFSLEPGTVSRLESALFDDSSDVEEICFFPLDRGAEGVARNLMDQWSLLLGYPGRIICPGEPLLHFREDVLLLLIATRTPAAPIPPLKSPFLWAGPQPAPEIKDWGENALGAAYLKNKDTGLFTADLLYTGLNLLFAAAWRGVAPHKAGIVKAHLQRGVIAIHSVLESNGLQADICNMLHENRAYDTAFIIGPPTGIRINWLERVDRCGRLVVEEHAFGESAHGPIVTVDPQVAKKFIHLKARAEMVEQYSEAVVADWEARFLHGQQIDDFLAAPPEQPFSDYRVPFYAEGGWYLPELKSDYNTRNDNLIIIDATSERYFNQALDELATYGSRYPRMVVISQGRFFNASVNQAVSRYPLSRLIFLPLLGEAESRIPVSDFLLPFAMNLVGMKMAAASEATKT